MLVTKGLDKLSGFRFCPVSIALLGVSTPLLEWGGGSVDGSVERNFVKLRRWKKVKTGRKQCALNASYSQWVERELRLRT